MNQARRAAREKWRRIIEAQRISGQTVAAYCRNQAVTQASFFAWKRRLRPTVQATEFVQVRAAAEAKPAIADAAEGNSSAIELCLGGDRRLLVRRGVDRELLIEMIGILEGLA
jgi:hypothetical protein